MAESQFFAPRANGAEPEGVKRSDVDADRGRAQHACQAGAKGCRGRCGERDGQDAGGRHITFGHQVGNAAGQRGGFP
jgi:hypothetical protein